MRKEEEREGERSGEREPGRNIDVHRAAGAVGKGGEAVPQVLRQPQPCAGRGCGRHGRWNGAGREFAGFDRVADMEEELDEAMKSSLMSVPTSQARSGSVQR